MDKFKSSFLEIKALEKDNQMAFSGYGAVFGNKDAYGDVIAKGAFAKTIKTFKSDPSKSAPAMLLQHGAWHMTAEDMTPVGVWTEMKEDDHGLYVEGVLAPTERGRELYALMKMQPRPAINGLSIGYYPVEFTEDKVDGELIRTLTEIDLIELSLVTFPANTEARVNQVKNGGMPTIRELETALRDAGLSRAQAKAVLADGFKSLSLRDAEERDADEIAAILQRNIKSLTGKEN